MPRCVTCGTHSGENPILDAFFCTQCESLWCVRCEGAIGRGCPHCGSNHVTSFTLTEDAYL